MKLGVLTVALGDMTFDSACEWLSRQGVTMVEIGCGGYPGKSHCDPKELLADEEKLARFKETLAKYGLEISALSCHGNMVHPDRKKAERFEKDFDQTVLLAEKLDVHMINTFSGCPGGDPNSVTPNWVTCAWPEDYTDIVNYQWNEVLIPFWKKKVEFVKAHGVDKIALEMHPGFCVYNTKTLLRLREAVGPEIGANYDPSHLIWQGIDPVRSIREICKAGALFHFHAKDTKIDAYNTAVNGVLDYSHYGDELGRSWIFRTVGYGNGEEFWRGIISELRMNSYDYAVNIEHEDSLMSGKEGLTKAIRFLNDILIHEKAGELFWA